MVGRGILGPSSWNGTSVSSAAGNWSEMVTIGRITKAQGRLGEVAVTPMTDVPDGFGRHGRVFLRGEGGTPAPFEVERVRQHKGRPVLKLAGVESIGEAEQLAGQELRVLAEELERLPEDGIYHFELLGCEVWDERGGRLGVVRRVVQTGGTDLLEVLDEKAGWERLVPLCREICLGIDTGRRRIQVRAPEGLLELNAD